jgi:hypothetical protein
MISVIAVDWWTSTINPLMQLITVAREESVSSRHRATLRNVLAFFFFLGSLT